MRLRGSVLRSDAQPVGDYGSVSRLTEANLGICQFIGHRFLKFSEKGDHQMFSDLER